MYLTSTLIAIGLLLLFAVYFTVKLGFIQVSEFKSGWQHMFSQNRDESGLSAFSAAILTIGGRIGTANILGVAFAIYLCGYGVIFWLWVISFIFMAISFVEATLAQIYKKYDENNNYVGTPMIYIKRGLPDKFKYLAVVYGVLFMLTVGLVYIVFFTEVITNTLLSFTGVDSSFTLELVVVAIATLISAFAFYGGKARIIKIMRYAIPLMIITYISLVLLIAFSNYAFIPEFFQLILTNIFTTSNIITNQFFGDGVIMMIAVATVLVVLSTESGMGTSAISSGLASANNPAKQGFVNMVIIFIDTLICTLTAFVLMWALEYGSILIDNASTAELIMASFEEAYVGGELILLAVMIIFSLSTIHTSVLYGLTILKELVPTKLIKILSIVYVVLVLVLMMITPFFEISSSFVSTIIGTATLSMLLINTFVIFLLRNDVFKTYARYKVTPEVFRPNDLKIEYQDHNNNIWK